MHETRSEGFLDLDSWIDERRVVVQISGELDTVNCRQLRDELFSYSQIGHHRFAVELSGLAFMDSAGIGVLVGAAKRARASEGRLCLVGPKHHIRRLWETMGLAGIMPVFGGLDDAFSYLSAK
ncbi:MAG TPA: STAS domain-containing protein [Actinocrinis sp.]|uniref:STAS domain-containing protein n=1 Tax=Actinocrinis sp. TaxID=1920516 RepID=UPI002DDC9981|nr:STAS domain-containing protein [Actinocrinis sp.]HEV2344496.1 STAS domain-containing protein [Actinocrinis sp.]